MRWLNFIQLPAFLCRFSALALAKKLSISTALRQWWGYLKRLARWFETYYALSVIPISLIAFIGLLLDWPGFLLHQTLNTATHSLKYVQNTEIAKLSLNQYVERKQAYQTGFLTLFGALIGVVGLLVSIARYNQTRLEHRNIRFKEAVELLGHIEMDVRLGAIYSLEKLMQEKPEEFGVQVVNILASYIRNRGGQVTRAYETAKISFEEVIHDPELRPSSVKERREYKKKLKDLICINFFEGSEKQPSMPPYLDIVTALTVLAKRDLPIAIEQKNDFNLPEVNFALFAFAPYNLLHVYKEKTKEKSFWGGNLDRVDLKQKDLSRSSLVAASLVGAQMEGVNLYSANLTDANLHCACIVEACLTSADLTRVNFERADLRNAKLIKSCVTKAILNFASLNGVELRDAYLEQDGFITHLNLDNMPAYCCDQVLSDFIRNVLPVWNTATIWPDGRRRSPNNGEVIEEPRLSPS